MKKIIAIAILAMLAGMVQADFISLNLWHLDNDAHTIKDGESFGSAADSTVTANWSNHGGTGWSTTLWNDGTQSSVDYTVSATSAAGNSGLDDTAMRAGMVNYTGTANLATLSMNNINANFEGSYDVLVYLCGATSVSMASVSDGTTIYYFNTPDTGTAALTQVTSTTLGTYTEGNYVKFTGLTADTFTVTMSLPDIASVGIGGLQIVGTAVPEPATVGMLGLGALVTLLIRRFKRG